ncbi:MAG: endonuclease/exonuclease/phosphatase family protein [Candidatus Marinimicrobia bacterium]|nr:endonuclease/exonuclease/phosphatase family protein [Candidatus Neomarinimicrobiota bacterium]MCF7828603.1 endonuclease/exonuclease/phosphatase family protein [Candidatus Neomarinimicrobiota bacterium]MCF7880344.1 endonuclease/exonuclease/phosphatase family protein [Candidatus Neomarinimicrobiota bacterium]
MMIVVIILGCMAILSTIIPILDRDAWWIRIFDFPRIQIIVIALALLIAFIPWWDRRNIPDNIFMGLLAIAMVYQIIHMLPYTSLWKKQVLNPRDGEIGETISLLVTNILMTNRNGDLYRELLTRVNPDVHLILEADTWWEEELRETEDLFSDYVLYPLENTYGMLLYSKLPLEEVEVKLLAESDIPSIHAKVVLPGGGRVQLHCVHPRPPGHGKNPNTTHRDAELLAVAREVSKSDLPAIVTGDFNDVAWSYTTTLFQRISGLLDPRVGRGLYSTYHAGYPFFRFPLDHIFHSHHFRIQTFRRLQYIGSDHFPLYAELRYVGGDDIQEAIVVLEEHQEAMQEKLRKVELIDEF